MTPVPVRLHEDVQRELDDGSDYYDLGSRSLGSAFIDEVEAGFSRISKTPGIGAPLPGGRRQLVLARFPYSIIYELGDGVAYVLAIAHQRRRPFYWRDRT